MGQEPLTFLLQGGLDQVTPRIAVPNGRLLGALNHEPAERGLRRIDGIERHDGRLAPSEATYHYAPFTAGNTSLAAGQAVTGGTSGATGILVAAPTVTSGSYGGSDAVGYAGIYVTAGTFQNGEGLQVAAVTKMTLSAAPVERGSPTDLIDRTLIQAEMERRRALIQKPSGSGPVRGVWLYNGDLYAFRDNGPGSLGEVWVATTSGWANILKGERVTFTAGTDEFLEGETLTRGGVTSTIVRVVVRSGDWSTNDATGYIVITGRAGGDYTAGTATSSSGSATIAVQTSNLLAPGGRFRFRNHSFSGSANDVRMYGVNGISSAFEFDGTYFVPIIPLGVATRPTHLAIYAERLLLGYDEGNILISEIGYPLAFKAINDSAEINFGSPLTGMLDGASTACIWFGRSRIAYLTGTDTDTFLLKDISTTSGAKAESPVMGPQPYYLDDGGIRSLAASQDFGDWSMNAVSHLVEPFLRAKTDVGIRPIAVMQVKRKNQIRWFFDDGSGLILYLGRKAPEITPIMLPVVPYVACSGEDENGDEVLFMGAEDGYVYRVDAGTNFDGAAVEAWFLLHFVAPTGTAGDRRWHSVTFGIEGTSSVTAQIVADYDFGDPALQSNIESAMVGGGNFWDVEAVWDDVTVWDAPVQDEMTADLAGYGFNCAVGVTSELTYEGAYTVSFCRFMHSARKLRRK